MRDLLYLLTIAAALAAVTPADAQQPPCTFHLGFKTIADQIPEMVGRCLEDEHFNTSNGNAEQRTTAHHGNGGLLVWRKADNWTAYTDGYWSWVNGPRGLQKRLNTERFPWEAQEAPRAALSGETIAASLRASGLPVTAIVVHTAESDPNKLLGRPGQYTTKVNWVDERVKSQIDSGECTIEFFPDEDGMNRRARYIEEIGKAAPIFLQYVYTEPRLKAVLRVSSRLTPDQAKGYEAWLRQLRG